MAPPASTTDSSTVEPPDDTRAITVLHVDDQQEFLDLSTDILEREDGRLTVETATSASAGLDVLAECDVDCVVSDYRMPDMDGLEFLSAVREREPGLPFIIFTGKGDEVVASEAISAGVTDYLRKESHGDQFAVLANRIENAVQQHRTRQELAESRRRFGTLLSNLPGMAYRCRNEPGWPMEFVSDGSVALTGYEPSALVEGDVVYGEDVVHPDDREDVWETVQEALAAREPFRVEYRIRTADGETRWVWEQGRGVFEDDAVAVEGFVMNVTERTERERELEHQEFLFERVQDIADIGVWEFDPETDDLTWSDGVREIHGVEASYEPTLETAIEFYHPEDRPAIRLAVSEAIEDGEGYDQKLRIVRPDGDVRNVRARGEVVTDECGDTELLRGVFQDVTERTERERELERERAFTDQMLDTLEDVFYVITPDGEFRRWNDGVPEVTGYTDEEIAAMDVLDFFPEEEHQQVGEDIERVLSTGEATAEFHIRTADGEEIPYEFVSTRLTDPDGDLAGIVGVGRDVSERKARERELERQNERLEEFASVVSHDLRNPLNVAQGRLEILDENYDSEHIPVIGRAQDRMEAIIDDILTLAREGEQVDNPDTVALDRAAEACWRNVDTQAATLVTETERRLRADESRLQRLLENLVRNAVEHGSPEDREDAVEHGSTSPDSQTRRDAVEHGGGDVTVTVGELDDDTGFYVADDGPGIPPEERETVFESGYSSAQDGTGFGLSIVSEIAAAHGWEVDVTESADGGARFEITGVEFVDE